MVLGTRGSELALKQARMVAAAVREKCGIEPRIEVIRTSGDKVGRASGGRKGIFTAELERALLEKRIDLAVHSAKDLPSEMDEALAIAAVLPRAAVEDLLVAKTPASLSSLRQGARVATGSVRRQRQMRWQQPNVQLVELRGNVPTRLRKFAATDWDAIILARAGLERLGFLPPEFRFEQQQFFAQILSVEVFVPAGGQGVIAVQTRRGEEQLAAAVDEGETHLCLKAEREFLRLLEGDCDLPVGVHAQFRNEALDLRAQLFGEATAPKMESGRGTDPTQLAAEVFRRIEQEQEHEHEHE